MYGQYDEIFWFEKGKNGNPVLVRPDGSREWNKKSLGKFDSLRDKHAYQRANLVIKLYGIWDVTAFAALMQALILFKNPYANNEYYVFSSFQDAARHVNPYLSKKDIALCKKYVDDFYEDANLQAGWTTLILHPVCIKITIEENRILKHPIMIKDIGHVFCLDNRNYCPLNNLSDEEIKEKLNFIY